MQDPREAVEVIGRTAQLSFHPVLGADATATDRDESGLPVRIGPPAFGGDGVRKAQSTRDPQQGPGAFVVIDFQDAAAESWRELTAKAACSAVGEPGRRVAITLDGKVISSPEVEPGTRCDVGMIGSQTRITGRFSDAEAKDLALLINGGALPVPVEVVEQRTVGPTLGADAIDASARAAVIGLALTAAFLLVVYWLSGAVALLALVAYAGVSYAALLAIGATLTLPGLAGFVLAIGMAVDATVLVFERAREEYTPGRRWALPNAVERGYRGAWSAIVDSNITTLLAAGLLFWLASGPVRGFGVTLAIGVLASMFTSLVLTRVLLRVAGAIGLSAHPKASGLAHQGGVRRWVNRRDPGFLSRPGRWIVGAGVAVALALVALVVSGPTLGVEFTGGRVVEFAVPGGTEVERVRAATADAGFQGAVVQSAGDGRVAVRTPPISDDDTARLRSAVADVAGDATQVRDEKIGPSLGAELRTNALIALALAVAAQLGYLAIRFTWRLGLATVVALVQDVVVVVGVFALLGRTLDGVFLAAMLTVIGYSVNDTVVVFDRVRELAAKSTGTPFSHVVGKAVLQTLPRTVNTGIGVLFVLAALLALGDGSLADFALALLVGLVAGTVSTVTTAGPAAILLEGRVSAPQRRPAPAAAGRRAGRSAG